MAGQAFPDGIVYQVPAAIPPDEAAEIYVEAGWLDTPDAHAVKVMLQGTFAVSAAFHDGRLIGFMRALSDGVSDAYMLDLAVRVVCRKHGVGRKIVENLAAYLASLGIDWIVCVGAPGTAGFYAKTTAKTMAGFTPYRFFS